jgi:hypothetical protein
MSAECTKCGADIVYPLGTWPLGECPVCDAGFRLSAEEAQALWDASQSSENLLGRYWEHPVLGHLVARLSDWHKYESPL